MKLLTRDGAIIFGLVAAVDSIFLGVMPQLEKMIHVLPSVCISVFCIMGCTGLLNIQRLRIEDTSASVEFSTVCTGSSFGELLLEDTFFERQSLPIHVS